MRLAWLYRTFGAIRNGKAGPTRAKHGRSNDGRRLRLEPLECRSLLAVSALGVAVPYHEAPSTGAVAPLATAGPSGYTPAQIRQAYGFSNISFNNGTVAGDGSGTTIAIVDAYDDPAIAHDLHQFDLQFGLPDPAFAKVNQNGGTSLPSADSGWATEIALDVEWAHAIAPKAAILLVEAASSSLSDLLTAVDYARRAAGVVAVSMSWGGGEFSGENYYDSYFTTPSGHGGVTFVASSGDTGAPISNPASSPNVLSVGGTTLYLNSQGGYLSESGWSGSGGGISAYESQPSYQKGLVTQTTVRRANPDVAYDANPATGFSVYDSYNNGLSTPWGQWGGTSDAAPQWAALVAIADQGRILAGKGALDGATQTLPMLYAASAADFHDTTSGTSSGRPRYSATAGYDLVTGRGSPYADLVVSDLVGSGATITPPVGSTPPVVSGVVVAEATAQDGILQSNERGILTWAVAGSNPIASFSLKIDGSAVSTLYGPYGPYSGSFYCGGQFNPLSAGTHTYTIQVTDSFGLSGTLSGSFTVAAAAGPVISGVVVAEATAQNGILESNERGILTWAVAGSAPAASFSLVVDGSAVTSLYGPYGPYSGSYFYGGGFGPLSAGTHNYTIQVADGNGGVASLSGTFVVAAAAGPLISGVVVAEDAVQNGVLQSSEKGVVTWAVTDPNSITAKSLTIDGAPASALYGPYGPYSGSLYYAGVFGPLSVGSHNFVIQVSDSQGGSTSYSGAFSVAPAVLAPAAVSMRALATQPTVGQVADLPSDVEQAAKVSEAMQDDGDTASRRSAEPPALLASAGAASPPVDLPAVATLATEHVFSPEQAGGLDLISSLPLTHRRLSMDGRAAWSASTDSHASRLLAEADAVDRVFASADNSGWTQS